MKFLFLSPAPILGYLLLSRKWFHSINFSITCFNSILCKGLIKSNTKLFFDDSINQVKYFFFSSKKTFIQQVQYFVNIWQRLPTHRRLTERITDVNDFNGRRQRTTSLTSSASPSKFKLIFKYLLHLNLNFDLTLVNKWLQMLNYSLQNENHHTTFKVTITPKKHLYNKMVESTD